MTSIPGIYASQISGHLWAPSGAYDSIATTTVGAGGASSVTFSSIPSTYTHLQIRGIARSAYASDSDILRIRFNADTSSNYARHILYGTGTTALSSAAANGTLMTLGSITANTSTANTFSAHVIDILDYATVSKNRVLRALNGFEQNTSSSEVSLASGLFVNTNAVTSITIFSDNAANLVQYSSFALYGIKGN